MTRLQEDILIGIDYGSANIGIALGRNGFVSPIRVVSGKNDGNAIHEITRIALENRASKIIVGLPLTAEGKETHQTKKVRRFSKLLKTISKRPVEFHSEYATSKEAYKESLEKKLSTKKKSPKDHLAAALILKKYYNELI